MARSDRHQPPDRRHDGGPTEAAHFIAASLADLARVARRHGHDTLGYLLDLALMEAQEIAARSGEGSGQT